MSHPHNETLAHVQRTILAMESKLSNLRIVEAELSEMTNPTVNLSPGFIAPKKPRAPRNVNVTLPGGLSMPASSVSMPGNGEVVAKPAKPRTPRNGITTGAAILTALGSNGGMALADLVTAVSAIKPLGQKPTAAISTTLQILKKKGSVSRDGDKWVAVATA
jgi:hypothetical protein